jgi:dihydroorotate dehydrogenase
MKRKRHMPFDLYPFVKPVLHRLDPERAHELALLALERGLVPPSPVVADPILATNFLGWSLAHPIGLAAGFDKNARVARRMFGQGFSFVEVGGVTPLPQAGNPRPRVFRLRAEQAVINRMGFPNDGAEVVAGRLRQSSSPGMLGVNIASNADSKDPVQDFAQLVERFAHLCDFITLDVSCPNTENGQIFLDATRLEELLQVLNAFGGGANRPALVAKLSPDIEDARLAELLEVLTRAKIAAICMSNTTVSRPPGLGHRAGEERGGLSGAPLFALATKKLSFVHRLVGKRVPLIGTGGIRSGKDAYEKIRAGAAVLQIYTAMIYDGPAVVGRILRELTECLYRDGFTSIMEAVGTA